MATFVNKPNVLSIIKLLKTTPINPQDLFIM